ncbi:MAG: glycosyltransferase [Lachnospiraceae bacterium]|nr:glycosyltransferase [Lachnospiraceae bacterium]
MRKILFHLNCLERGGAERVVATLSGQFVKNGYEVLIATEWQGEEEYEIDSRITRVHVGLDQKQEGHGRIGRYLDRIQNLRNLIKKTKPDIVIAFARLANYRALMATIGLKTPVMISVRINPIGFYDFLPDKILIPTILRRASGCVFQTPKQRDFFPKFLQKKSKIILNPINDKFIGNPIPDEKDREKAVVHSGRLVDFKNQALLIRAFISVHEKHPDYVLKLYGPDSFDGTKQQLEALIKETNSAHYVFLMGSSAQLERDLIGGAVAAFSSDYEGMPNAMLEAMALGLPVVATDCPPGGPRMVIEDGKNGLLVPIKDEKALSEAINRLIEDRELAARLGAEAAKIGELASSERIFEEWKRYAEQIINNA